MPAERSLRFEITADRQAWTTTWRAILPGGRGTMEFRCNTLYTEEAKEAMSLIFARAIFDQLAEMSQREGQNDEQRALEGPEEVDGL